ncbi:MAG: type II and III secretion system protein family protein [Pseudomonadota bacterium]|nr:type II and III secretion system protein family protein [Pseudomonadota bacterium]
MIASRLAAVPALRHRLAAPAIAAGLALVCAPLAAQTAPGPMASAATAVEIGAEMSLTVGKSTLLRLPTPIDRISVGNPAVADVTLISNRELYLLGKTFGSTNVMLWRKGGATTVLDVVVGLDTAALLKQIHAILPNETGIEVRSAADSIVLAGTVSGPMAANEAVQIAEGFMSAYARGLAMPIIAGDGEAQDGQVLKVSMARQGSSQQFRPKVINLMRTAQPAQVMLEVKVAEISKTVLDQLGSAMQISRTNGSWTYGILNSLLTGSGASLLGLGPDGKFLQVDAEFRDGLVKILAEPNMVAISGQEASFLAGGKIFIPVARKRDGEITLEEKEFGVGLKFTPSVLDGGRINLKVAPEVSELSQTGNPFTTVDGVTTVFPAFTTRRAETTVQLMDGQSLAIAGLIQNNVKETMRKMPVLGDVPILGALFRSAEFQGDRTELVFLITPRLVKPIDGAQAAMPTDHFTPPSRSEFFLGGQLEGSGHADVPPDRGQAAGSNYHPLELR